MKPLSCFIIIFCTLITAACAGIHHQTVAPSQRNRICEDLKQRIIMNSVRNVPDEQGNSPTELAQAYRSYEQNQCDQKLGVSHVP